MVTRIHPEINAIAEYDPFKDEKVIDLGPNERMDVRQALTVAYNVGLSDVILVGSCNCGCGLIKIISSGMTTEKMLMMVEKLKLAIMDRELSKVYLDGYNPEDTG